MSASFVQILIMNKISRLLVLSILLSAGIAAQAMAQASSRVARAWPDIDFSEALVDPGEIISGGVGRDGIPPVYDPAFEPQAGVTWLEASEPVISLEVEGVARAYPLQILTLHEIVNDRIGGIPVAVTYCPLCNAAIVFDRRLGGQTLTLGVSGLLRNSDLIMWDHETESLWQQFEGLAIAGDQAGAELARLPSRLESYAEFQARHPDGEVLSRPRPNFPYGRNPYVGYDELWQQPFLYRGEMPEGIPPMLRVVVVDDQAWNLALVAEAGEIISGDIRLTRQADQNSALDAAAISGGRLVTGVQVEARDENGNWQLRPYDVTFAFVFHAFRPEGTIFME